MYLAVDRNESVLKPPSRLEHGIEAQNEIAPELGFFVAFALGQLEGLPEGVQNAGLDIRR